MINAANCVLRFRSNDVMCLVASGALRNRERIGILMVSASIREVNGLEREASTVCAIIVVSNAVVIYVLRSSVA